jgi:histidine ammonia-lyase
MTVAIDGNQLSLEDVLKVAKKKAKVEIQAETAARIRHTRRALEDLIGSKKAFYGINTGFGALATREIDIKDLKRLQKNLIHSHTAGVGDFFQDEIVRGIILLRANVLAKGFSGVRLKVVNLLVDLLNHNILPRIPCKGSVGASGDLAPLSHLALTLIGEGRVKYRGRVMDTDQAFRETGLRPITLVEKEGLALINGTQVMTAIGVLNVLDAESLVEIADLAGAITFEAQLGNPSPFYDEIQVVRPHPGQLKTARNIMRLIKDSPLWESHRGKRKVQDAYSIRCIPQVHGAVRDNLNHIRKILHTEVNSATENPLIFPETGRILSGGNFHGEPVAFAMDFLSIIMAELGNISERRIDRLLNPATNMGLPPFLIQDNGLNSGFMIAHITATSLTSENRTLAHPSSVDNIPTSANQEDHVSMGTIGARTAREIIQNVKYILAIELMVGLQALDFYKLKTSTILEEIKNTVRKKVPFLDRDSRLDGYFKDIVTMMDNGTLANMAGNQR